MDTTGNAGKESEKSGIRFFFALYLVLHRPLEILWVNCLNWRVAYFKARGKLPPRRVTAIEPIPDPILDRQEELGIKDCDVPEFTMPEDAPDIVLYRTLGGKYVTPDMIVRGQVPYSTQLTTAVEIGEEEADRLIYELESIAMESELKEYEKILLQELKKGRASRYVF